MTEEDYYMILKREQRASTIFLDCAIPHEFEINSKNSMISIMKSYDGFSWDDQKIQMVILVTISNKELVFFRQYLTALYSILEKIDIKELSKKEVDFDAFINILKNYGGQYEQ